MTDDLETRAIGSDRLVEEICAAYGIATPDAWRDLGGSWTTNLRLDLPGGALVARLHQGSTPVPRLAAIQAARSAVADARIPAVQPIATPTGSGFVTLASGRLAELEQFVQWDTRMSTEPLLERGFGILAHVHDALRSAELPAGAATVRYANHIGSAGAAGATRLGAQRIRQWHLGGLTAFADRVVAHVDAVSEAEEPLRGTQLVQIVHGDFWDNNVLFRGDTLAAVIDFDFMARRPRVDDLALTAYFHLLQPGRGLPTPHDAQVLRRFTDAYDASAAVPLGAEERAALPLAIARQPAWSVGRRVLELDEGDARRHARDAAAELPVAQAILADLSRWQDGLA